MLENKRKRAVVLALLAFFCTAAATYVAVEWGRVSGSLIALVKGKDDGKSASKQAVAMSVASNVAVAKAPALEFMPQDEPAHEPEVALMNARRHVASAGGGSDSFKGKSEDDLFKDGDPAAGIPAGKFIVAQNDTPAAPDAAGGSPGAGVSGVVSSVAGAAPAPTGNGGTGGGGLLQPTTPAAPTPAIPEASSLAMMTLGGLFVAVAAARRRKLA